MIGTKADYYMGRGPEAEWLGSQRTHGNPPHQGLLKFARTQEEFRDRVRLRIEQHGDVGTLPEAGWPWQHDDSRGTDYTYAFFGDRVWCSYRGQEWFPADRPEPEHENVQGDVFFPDMTSKRKPQ